MRRVMGILLGAALVACGGDAVVDGTGGSGASGGGSGGGGTGGGTGGSAGAGGTSCADLEAAYAEALAIARSCDTAINTIQCTELVFTGLPCPCQEIFVNPANDEAIQQLASLRDQYFAQGCGPEACPTIACVAPTTGSCAATGMGDFCQSE